MINFTLLKRSIKIIAVFLCIIPFAQIAQSQTPIDVGPQVSTFTSMVRGYYFTAPTSFNICQLYIPTDASSAVQNIEVVRFNSGPPPAFAGTTNAFTSLFYINNYAPNTPIPVSIQVNAGDVIGVYGARGTNMVNSYGPTQHVTTIQGNNVTLFRSGMQANLNTGQMANIWAETGFNIGRIIMYIDCCTPPNPFPAPIQGDSIACIGDFETYTIDTVGVGAGAMTYTWSVPNSSQIINGQGTNSITVLHSGSVAGTICVTAANTCDSVQQCLNIYKETLDMPNMVTGPDTVCAGASYNFSIPTDPEANGYLWQLPPGATITAGQLTNNVTVEFGQLTPSAVICGASFNNCDTSNYRCKLVTMDTIPLITSSIFGPKEICEGGSAVYNTNNIANADVFNWTLDNGSSVTSGQGTVSIDADLPNIGITTICLEASNQCGSSLPLCDTITVDQFITADAGVDTSFCENNGAVNAVLPALGTGEWSQVAGNGSVTFGDSSNASTGADVNILGVYEFEWAVTNGACFDSDTVEVTYDQVPLALAGQDRDICGLSQPFNAAAPNIGSGVWSQILGPGTSTYTDSTNQAATVTVDNYGSYQYVWLLTNGACEDSDTVDFDFYEQPNATYAGEDTVVCVPFFTLNADSPAVGTGIWNLLSSSLSSNFDPQDPDAFVDQVEVGTYVFEWEVSNGPCAPSTDVVEIRVADPNSVLADFDYEPKEINAFDQVQFIDLSSGATMWDWAFGNGEGSTDQNPIYAYPEGDFYTVLLTASNEDGCFDTASVTFEVFSEIIVPNIITPNGDNINDVLEIKAGGLTSFTLQIFNRFGRKVFETDDYKNYWAGTNENNQVVDGVYFYAITVETRSQGTQTYSGTVTVLR